MLNIVALAGMVGNKQATQISIPPWPLVGIVLRLQSAGNSRMTPALMPLQRLTVSVCSWQ